MLLTAVVLSGLFFGARPAARTKEALRAKKTAGIKLGRSKGAGKRKLDPYWPKIVALLANGATQKFIAKRYGTTESNLSNYLKKRGLRRAEPSV